MIHMSFSFSFYTLEINQNGEFTLTYFTTDGSQDKPQVLIAFARTITQIKQRLAALSLTEYTNAILAHVDTLRKATKHGDANKKLTLTTSFEVNNDKTLYQNYCAYQLSQMKDIAGQSLSLNCNVAVCDDVMKLGVVCGISFMNHEDYEGTTLLRIRLSETDSSLNECREIHKTLDNILVLPHLPAFKDVL